MKVIGFLALIYGLASLGDGRFGVEAIASVGCGVYFLSSCWCKK